MESWRGVGLSLLVNDYDEAIRFYCERTQLFSLIADTGLGHGDRYVVLGYENPEAAFCLVLFKATTRAMSAIVGRQAADLPLLVLPVDDCLGTYEQLRAAGVAFAGEPFELPYSCQASMIDPFGNVICLAESY